MILSSITATLVGMSVLFWVAGVTLFWDEWRTGPDARGRIMLSSFAVALIIWNCIVLTRLA